MRRPMAIGGLADTGLGQYQRAIGDDDEAIRLNPVYDDAYYNRGGAYRNLSQSGRLSRTTTRPFV